MRVAHSLVLTVTLGFALPAGAAVGTVHQVTRELQKYNTEERKLADTGEHSPNELIAHWERLGTVRTALLKHEARGTLKRLSSGERVTLRHELAELLGSAADFTAVKGSRIPAGFMEADDLRKQVLAEIAAIADRNLEFDLHEILGIKVDSGGT
jgi:hypothetical protein